jgi:hypothetical protein
MQGCAPARRRIRVLALPKQPSLWVSDSFASRRCDHLNSTLTVLGQSSISRFDPRLAFKSPSRRKRQRLPPSLLIENASGPHYLSPKYHAEAFPIKASDIPGTGWFVNHKAVAGTSLLCRVHIQFKFIEA